MSRTARTRSTFVAVSVLAACAGLGVLASPAQAATVTGSTTIGSTMN
ncbi:hypothetical protein OG259_06370 [Streptomyces sp. NBC_00250]|nr:hypothetical protein [Streptomyces sp. NBC_00250]